MVRELATVNSSSTYRMDSKNKCTELPDNKLTPAANYIIEE